RLMQEADDIVLEVSDDGRGVASGDLVKPQSFGLHSIRERLNSLGGTMHIQSRSPRGTMVVMRAPLNLAYNSSASIFRSDIGRDLPAISNGQSTVGNIG
ncbi:MAG TPA: ATP-binding protein, partial [Rhodocyclaceae bacterium]|nr:ATP-binding protein [Rhodocyclaceae bacterium]